MAAPKTRHAATTRHNTFPIQDTTLIAWRREAPGTYESYADVEPGKWTHLRIEVFGSNARLYVGNAEQPALIVHDLKRGSDAHGSVGLFVDNGTDGHFRSLRIRPE
jgi:hypothetical protein